MPPGLYAFSCHFLSRLRRALWPQNFTFQAYCFQAHFMFQTGFTHHSQSIFGMWRFRILHWVEPLHFWILDSQRCVPSLSIFLLFAFPLNGLLTELMQINSKRLLTENRSTSWTPLHSTGLWDWFTVVIYWQFCINCTFPTGKFFMHHHIRFRLE